MGALGHLGNRLGQFLKYLTVKVALKRRFHDITGRTMANPAPTPTDALGSSPADSESIEAAASPQNAPLATMATAGHHGPRTSRAGGGEVGEDGVESDQRLSVS